MKRFLAPEIRAFLLAVDRNLDHPFRLDVIGGAAASLSFRAKRGTLDIDTTNSVIAIEKACERARTETGLEIPLGAATVYDAPYEYESRLKRVPLKGLKKLKITVPEKHDWALMKIMRLLEKDIEAIKEVAGTVGFKKELFLDRFLKEMTHVIGRRRDVINNFLAMMEELYGEKEADRMEEAIRSHRHWR